MDIVAVFIFLIMVIAILVTVVLTITTKVPGANIFTHALTLLIITFSIYTVLLLYHVVFEQHMENTTTMEYMTETQ